MTDEQFEDLKQLIDARASATEKYLEQRMATKEDLVGFEQRLNKHIDQLDEKLDTIHDGIAEVTDDHDKRLTRLEQQRA